ncbi:hypothetical protein [Burkholderia sp. 8Y]|uniref:hypothetical protein n=1 Tax=Burkholderia sp. 8Y TaxID=2653133 RepID=UPI001F35F2E8|nr:hypothetical protein [Burkholderia sp. 8Y]
MIWRKANAEYRTQEKLIEELERDGHDTSKAHNLLAVIREAQKAMQGHRDRIQEAIDLFKQGFLKGDQR